MCVWFLREREGIDDVRVCWIGRCPRCLSQAPPPAPAPPAEPLIELGPGGPHTTYPEAEGALLAGLESAGALGVHRVGESANAGAPPAPCMSPTRRPDAGGAIASQPASQPRA